jgi:hypothetical protein
MVMTADSVHVAKTPFGAMRLPEFEPPLRAFLSAHCEFLCPSAWVVCSMKRGCGDRERDASDYQVTFHHDLLSNDMRLVRLVPFSD